MGFWESLKDLFLPDEDRSTYAEGLRRGGFLVTVRATDAQYQRALDILDDEGTIDIDERAASWRSEGWTGNPFPGAGQPPPGARDRAAGAGDNLFRERTIEAEERVEEAVVAKEARVKEELVLKKDVNQRTETVSDKVRRTEVEVEDERANANRSGERNSR